MPEEAHLNPAAPEEAAESRRPEQPLSNKDFRKLLETPRHPGSAPSFPPSVRSGGPSFSRRHGAPVPDEKKPGKAPGKKKGPGGGHFKPRREEEDELAAIMRRYRDRAKERRVGEGKETEEEMLRVQAGGYRAVAPSLSATLDAKERRKQAIQESKYLGGDMEHTHLVKGLDYALLQKVRSEIVSKEAEEEELESAFSSSAARTSSDELLRKETETEIKHPLAKNIFRVLFKDEPPKTNELFAPRRMAYVVEMDDDAPDAADIPTTLIRSKADCPVDETANANLSTNDMVIQKLGQVLAYLRADNRKKKKDPAAAPASASASASASAAKNDAAAQRKDEKGRKDRNRRDRKGCLVRERESRQEHRQTPLAEEKKDRPFSYFGDSSATAEEATEVSVSAAVKEAAKAAPKERDIFQAEKGGGTAFGAATGEDAGYAECYPGGLASYEAAGESDDEADYTKMDMGNRKGPVKRWDFDNEEDYEAYMSKREAMPRAAYQYGVKMSDGRKTRKNAVANAGSDQKAKIDKQWNQISKILAKRDDGKKEIFRGPAAKKMKPA